MKRIQMLLTGMFVLSAALAQAQSQGNGVSRFSEEKLKQIEANLLRSLESDIPGIQAPAAKNVRDIKAMVPDYVFSYRVTIALMRIVKNEQAMAGSRILAALALHDLNSETGDYAIKMTAQFSDEKRFKGLCSLLTHKRDSEKHLARAGKPSGSSDVAVK